MYVCIICTYHWNWSLQTQLRLWVWNFWNPIIGHEASGLNLLGVECWIHLSQCIFWTCGLLQQSSIPQFIARFFEWEQDVTSWDWLFFSNKKQTKYRSLLIGKETYHQCATSIFIQSENWRTERWFQRVHSKCSKIISIGILNMLNISIFIHSLSLSL